MPFHLPNTLIRFPLAQPWLESRETTFCILNPIYFKRGKNKTKQTMKQTEQEFIDPWRDSGASPVQPTLIIYLSFIY